MSAITISNTPPKVWAVYEVGQGIGGSSVLLQLFGSIEGAERYIRGVLQGGELIMVELSVLP
jgi:hypothetical protein